MADAVEILLVEDNPTDAELAQRALKKLGLPGQVHAVRDGEEALDFVFARGAFGKREVGQGLAVILLDLKLPKVDGLEVLRAVKSDPRTRDIPVVMLTSSKVPADVEACYRAGANSYIVKPVDFAGHAQVLRDLGFYWARLNVGADG